MDALKSTIELEKRVSAHNYAPLPVVLARGQGAHLWDTAGRRYVDMMSAYSAASHGHAHPRILSALKTQAERLAVPSRAFYNERLAPLLAELCALIGRSEGHFSRSFKRTFGEAPHIFVIRRRLELAAQYMLETDAPLSCIAVQSGFTDQPHLCKHFRQVTGETPAAWRRARRAPS